MKKLLVFTILFAGLVGLPPRLLAQEDQVSEADADPEKSVTSEAEDQVGNHFSCDCPPGIVACSCADGTKGKPSNEAPAAAGPIRVRTF